MKPVVRLVEVGKLVELGVERNAVANFDQFAHFSGAYFKKEYRVPPSQNQESFCLSKPRDSSLPEACGFPWLAWFCKLQPSKQSNQASFLDNQTPINRKLEFEKIFNDDLLKLHQYMLQLK